MRHNSLVVHQTDLLHQKISRPRIRTMFFFFFFPPFLVSLFADLLNNLGPFFFQAKIEECMAKKYSGAAITSACVAGRIFLLSSILYGHGSCECDADAWVRSSCR